MSQCPKKTKKKTNKNPIKLKKYSASEKLEIIERRDRQWQELDQNFRRTMNERSSVRGIYRVQR